MRCLWSITLEGYSLELFFVDILQEAGLDNDSILKNKQAAFERRGSPGCLIYPFDENRETTVCCKRLLCASRRFVPDQRFRLSEFCRLRTLTNAGSSDGSLPDRPDL